MSEVAHTITCTCSTRRAPRAQRKHPELAGRIPKKELAAYLNLTETLAPEALQLRPGAPGL